MPLYEFRCSECDAVFEVRREMAAANDPATCPAGHAAGIRLLSRFAATGRATPVPSCGSAGADGCGAACPYAS